MKISRCILALAVASGHDPTQADDGELHLNDIQLIGTHNSYHLAPAPAQLAAMGRIKAEWRESLDYTHRPLTEQLDLLGLRHFELDVYADPEGGHFASPLGLHLSPAEQVREFRGEANRAALAAPGFKVLHVPDFDFWTTTPTLIGALREIRAWSRGNPGHLPILVMLEMKDERKVLLSKRPIPFDRAQLEAVEGEILQVFGRDELITPDAVRGGSETLRAAVLERGWPKLKDARGKVMFALDNGGRIRDAYLEGNPSLEGRLLFASVGEGDPAAAWFKLNDPVRSFDRIQRLVRAGFLVRTRADSETREARRNDTRRRDRALASGAQFISTDFPEKKEGVSDYAVRFGEGKAHRRNPLR